MKTVSLGTTLAAALLFSASALAAPCNTGSTKGKTPDGQQASSNSSATDQSSKNMAGGNQPASPGTVGAMNNAGANQGQPQQADASKAGDKKDPGAANLAGGNQPASPGTVGAMNNTGATQTAGKDNDC